MRRNGSLTGFIISVRALWNIDCIADLLLSQIPIFSQITNTTIIRHTHHRIQYRLNDLFY